MVSETEMGLDGNHGGHAYRAFVELAGQRDLDIMRWLGSLNARGLQLVNTGPDFGSQGWSRMASSDKLVDC